MPNYNFNQDWENAINSYNEVVKSKTTYLMNPTRPLASHANAALNTALGYCNSPDKTTTLPTIDVFIDMLNKLPLEETKQTLDLLANGQRDDQGGVKKIRSSSTDRTNALASIVGDAKGLMYCIHHLHPQKSLEIIYCLFIADKLGSVIRDEYALRDVRAAYEDRLTAWGLGLDEYDKIDCIWELNDILSNLEKTLAKKVETASVFEVKVTM